MMPLGQIMSSLDFAGAAASLLNAIAGELIARRCEVEYHI